MEDDQILFDSLMDIASPTMDQSFQGPSCMECGITLMNRITSDGSDEN